MSLSPNVLAIGKVKSWLSPPLFCAARLGYEYLLTQAATHSLCIIPPPKIEAHRQNLPRRSN